MSETYELHLCMALKLTEFSLQVSHVVSHVALDASLEKLCRDERNMQDQCQDDSVMSLTSIIIPVLRQA